MGRNFNRKVVPLHGTNNVPSDLAEGEIAVRTTAGSERLFVKNNNSQVVELGPAHYTILTQSEYDALDNKPANHIYYIKSNA